MVVTTTIAAMNPVAVVAPDDKSTRMNRSTWILAGVSGVILAEVSRLVEDCDPLAIPSLSREGMVLVTMTMTRTVMYQLRALVAPEDTDKSDHMNSCRSM